jgi:hypothetical protein
VPDNPTATTPRETEPGPRRSFVGAWSSLIRKAIGAWQIAGGAALGLGAIWVVAHGTKLDLVYELMLESAVVAAIWGGAGLWQGRASGYLACAVLQLLQVVSFVSPAFTFSLLLGPGLFVFLPNNASPAIDAALRGTLTFYLGPARGDLNTSWAINLVAAGAFVVLVWLQRSTGQPWLPEREDVVPWDRARIIGAYQIAAGALGMLNALSAPAFAIPSLLFSMLVVGSGIALVRAMPGSDALGIVVNGAQVPAIAFDKLMYLVRSGVSCVAAFTAGQETGLHVQLDVGATINAPLAPRIDGFVGINVTALALALLLAQHRARPRQVEGQPSRRPIIRQF